MITTDGLVRFWIGTVLLTAATVATLWVTGAHFGTHTPSQVTTGFGIGIFVLCLLLLLFRWLDQSPGQIQEVPVVIGFFVNLGYAFYQTVHSIYGPADMTGWLWGLFAAHLIGFGLVFSLGDYPP